MWETLVMYSFFLIFMKQVFIFCPDKAFSIIFFSIFHDVESNCFRIDLPIGSAYLLVQLQDSFVIRETK